MKHSVKRDEIGTAETSGQLLQVMQLSIESEQYKDILSKHGHTAFEPDTWYPLALILDILEAIEKQPNSTQNLVSIGIQVTEVIDFRAQFPSLLSVMENLNQLEQSLTRNNPGGWNVRQLGDRCIEVIDHTVWPHDLEYGVLYGIARLYRNENRYVVERVGIEIDEETGDEIGIYYITW